jgi:hypothetical protein
MKMQSKVLSSNLGLTLVAGLLAAGAATGEEIKPLKKTAAQQLSDGLYGKVESRLQSFQATDANGDVQRYRLLALRPKLGTTLMNEKLDIGLTTPVTNAQYSAKTERPQSELETNLSLFEHKNLTVGIYTVHYLKSNEKPYAGYADLDITVKRERDFAGVGKLEGSFLIEPEAQLTTSKVPATVTRAERVGGVALAESESAPEVEQKETTKALYMYPALGFSPSAVAGLRLGLGAIFASTYQPKYIQVINDDGTSKLKDDGYKVTRETQMRYTVNYKVSDTVSVYNQLRQNFVGYLEKAQAEKSLVHLDNRTGIIVSLF